MALKVGSQKSLRKVGRSSCYFFRVLEDVERSAPEGRPEETL